MIRVNRAIYKTWINHFKNYLPEEACGFIYGYWDEGEAIVSSFVWVPNVADNPEHSFQMGPADIMRLLEDSAPESGASISRNPNKAFIIGMFHSHPGPPVPSTEDLDGIRLWPQLPTYWIVSCTAGIEPDIAVYAVSTLLTSVLTGEPFGTIPLSFDA
nr:M67 family metallopeptidase [Paenibacillus lutrae]